MTFFLSFLLLTNSFAREQSAPLKRVAVIVVLADPGYTGTSASEMATTFPGHAFLDATTLAKGIYGHTLKFDQVILLQGYGDKLTPEMLKEKLGSLRNVGDLRVDFIGHGATKAKSSLGDPSLPSFTLSAKRVQALNLETQHDLDGQSEVTWVSGDKNAIGAVDEKTRQLSRLLGYKRPKSALFTADSFRNAIRAFHENNDGVVTLILLSCESGAVAEALRKEPKTIVFGASPATELFPLWADPSSGTPSSNLSLYYEQINSKQGAVAEANQMATEIYRRRILEHLGKFGIIVTPRSPYYESIIGWCREHGEDHPPIPKSVHSQNKAMKAARAELRVAKDALKSTPEGNSETEIGLRKTQRDIYNNCRKDAAQVFEEKVDPYGSVLIKKLSEWELAKVNLNQQIAHLGDYFIQLLTEPQVSRLKGQLGSYIQRTTQYFKEVPRQQWGFFGQMYDDYQNGKLSDQLFIDKLRETTMQMKAACSEGDPFRYACKKFFDAALEIDEFSRAFPIQQPPSKQCDPFDFQCMGPRTNLAGAAVYTIWQGHVPPPAILAKGPEEREAYCHHLAFHDSERQSQNLQLDEACFDDFENRADRSEWDNLDRLWDLGQRSVVDTRQRISTDEPAASQEGQR